jgi:hypothetical protein
MTSTRRGFLIGVAAACTLCAGTVALAASDHGASNKVSDYLSADGGTYAGVRPTAVGLPQIGYEGTIGAAELNSPLKIYHDSGRYERDLELVGDDAKAYIARRLDDDAAPAKRVKVCRTKYKRLRSGVHRGLYKRTRPCSRKRIAPRRLTGKPAIVIDIDETALSNYSGLALLQFSGQGTTLPAILGTGTAIKPTLDIYKLARRRGVAVFFVTGRPDLVSGPTTTNLKTQGYTSWAGLMFKPGGMHTLAYKAGARAAIEKKGYDIVANLGDQESDLDGGHADRGFKYPNPFYFISD